MARWRLTRERALARLRDVKESLRAHVDQRFGFKAKDCATCLTPCCADAEFVNVNVTRLEADAMMRVLGDDRRFSDEDRARVLTRARDAISAYGLSAEGDTFGTTYACPLFEPGAGCLVHRDAKPAPCIHHGCYEREEDLPGNESLVEAERTVADLNRLVYGADVSRWGYRTIPVWLVQLERNRERKTRELTSPSSDARA